MSGDLVPEEAIAIGADALLGVGADERDDLHDDMRAVLEAAAPTIIAAELERLSADGVVMSFAMRDLLQARASVLRGEGDPK